MLAKKSLALILMSLMAFGCEPVEKTKKETTKTADTAKRGGSATGDSDLIPVGTSYTKGPKDALITIIEFSEFQCPFCSRVLPTLKQITDTYKDKVRIVFKHAPSPSTRTHLSQPRQPSPRASKILEMHDKLFQSTKKLKKADIDGYAKELALDIKKFEADLNSKETKDAVAADMALAKKVGARGTPNFFVNGEQVTGARPFPAFKTVIDKQLKAAEAAIKAGTKAAMFTLRWSKRTTKNQRSAQATKSAQVETQDGVQDSSDRRIHQGQ